MFVQPHIRESLGIARLMTPNGKMRPDIRRMREHTLQFIKSGSRELATKQRGHAKQLASDIQRGCKATRTMQNIQQRKQSLAPYDARWPIAIHEAGHAVAAIGNRVKFSTASVVRNGDTLGEVRLYGLARCRPVTALVIAVCGPISEAKLEGSTEIALGGGDKDIVAEQLRRTGSREQAEATYARARSTATVLVNEFWPAIRAVARQLVNDKWLCEDKVAEIVRESVRR